MTGLGPTVFLLSVSLLAFEVVLVRFFAVETFGHLTYMAVGLALLGFAVSGTVLVVAREWVVGVRRGVLGVLVTLTPFALLMAPVLSHLPGYDPTQLLWEPGQWVALAAVYASLAIPFFVGGGAIALALDLAGERVGGVYGWNMAGSGVGTLLALPLLAFFPPDRALAVTVLPAAGAAVVIVLAHRRTLARLAVAFGVSAVAVTGASRPPWSLEITDFKALPQVEAYPDARRVDKAWGPTGWVTAVRSPAVHHAPGLSLAYEGELPEQTGLFVDGESAGAVSHGDAPSAAARAGMGRERGEEPARPTAEELPSFLGWLPSAVLYALEGDTGTPAGSATPSAPAVLVLGSGDGTEVLNALSHGADAVVAVELVAPLVELARGIPSTTARALEDPRVTVVTGDARAYAQTAHRRFDRVVLPPAGAFNATASGIQSGGENFLDTVEGYRSYLERLAPGGILAMTRWTRTPPRDNVRAILTMGRALGELDATGDAPREAGEGPGDRLVFLRSWATGTLLVKPDGFSPVELTRIRRFARNRYFDVDWPPSRDEETPVYNALERPVYEEAARALAAGSGAAARFAEDYAFDVTPPTDDRPYFGRFLRLTALPGLLERGPGEWLPVAEWGTLAEVATLLQSGLLAVVLLGVPLLFLVRRGSRSDDERIPVARTGVYFLAIGFGFLLVEMSAIQRLGLILGHPVYATGVALAGILAFSGLGSALSDRLRAEHARTACGSVAGLALVAAVLAPEAGALLSLPLAVRATVALAGLTVLGLAMGGPFPLGLRKLVGTARGGVGWAWAANGVASVTGAALAVLVSVAWGARGAILAGAACYAVAAWAAGARAPADA